MKRRPESFFGLHFDFHASPGGPDQPPVGATLSEEEIREICTLLKPDFLQIDCKGHPGWASYPTALENAMPAFRDDPLEKWRKVTREEDVALYMHYSGVWDYRYCAEHPEDAVLNADGTRDTQATRPAGGYADKLMIPQMCELAGKYGVDGIWIDGDCWGSKPDYDPETIAAFEKEYGISLGGELPDAPGKPYYEEYREFCREQFRSYVRHYTDTVHEKYPWFQIASNWSYTDHMPEPVTADVDFISGDLSPVNSFNSARYAGRAIARQGRTWDLMSWDFRNADPIPGFTVKHIHQVLQEAASVISLGGGFQNYIPQFSDGTPRMKQIRRMKKLEEFLRPRQPYCFRGKILPQVGILFSTHDRNLESTGLYSRTGMDKCMGLTALICDAGHSVELCSEFNLEQDIGRYPVLVVPELYREILPETADLLMGYVLEGGQLILTGNSTAAYFASSDLPFTAEALPENIRQFTLDGLEYGNSLRCTAVRSEQGEVLATVSESARSESLPMTVRFRFGRGSVTVIGFDIGSEYLKAGQYLHRELIQKALDAAYEPLVRLEGAEGTVEVVDLEKDGQLMIQLVNANGNHRCPNILTEDFIPPCLNIRLSLKADKAPSALMLQPEGKPLDFIYENGRAFFTVNRLDIHSVIQVLA